MPIFVVQKYYFDIIKLKINTYFLFLVCLRCNVCLRAQTHKYDTKTYSKGHSFILVYQTFSFILKYLFQF